MTNMKGCKCGKKYDTNLYKTCYDCYEKYLSKKSEKPEIIDQSKLFTNTQKAFNLNTLQNLLNNGKESEFKKAKEYFLQYFAKSTEDIFYKYEPSEDDEHGTIQNFTPTQMNAVFKNIPTIKISEEDEEGGEGGKNFSLRQWFATGHHDTFKINSDPRTKRFYVSKKTEQRYINLSKWFLHQKIKPYKSYSNEIKK